MTFFLAVLFGLIQGVTEFLPISSSGHLVLLGNLFGVSCNFVFFSLLLHLATLFAVLVVLRKQIFFLLKNPFSKLGKNIVVATIPTILIVLLFKDFFENAFSGLFLPFCFVFTATLLLFCEFFPQKNKANNKLKSIIIGISQGIAVLPGISRSGATICTGIFCGLSRQEASQFSFLISIPIIFASMIYELFNCFKNNLPIFDTPIFPTITAFFVAFFVGIVCVKFMLNALQKIKLYWFSIYLIILAGIMFVF